MRISLMEENKTPTAGIQRIPCRRCSLLYDDAIDWVGNFLHVPRKCHIWHRTSGTVPPTPAQSLSHIHYHTYQKYFPYSTPSPFFRFFWAVESMSLIRLSWLTSLAPGS